MSKLAIALLGLVWSVQICKENNMYPFPAPRGLVSKLFFFAWYEMYKAANKYFIPSPGDELVPNSLLCFGFEISRSTKKTTFL